MTRAKTRLVLTFARLRTIYGSTSATIPSSFLADIDPMFVRIDETDGFDVII
jgi:superfamily I DNA/RNA helicase